MSEFPCTPLQTCRSPCSRTRTSTRRSKDHFLASEAPPRRGRVPGHHRPLPHPRRPCRPRAEEATQVLLHPLRCRAATRPLLRAGRTKAEAERRLKEAVRDRVYLGGAADLTPDSAEDGASGATTARRPCAGIWLPKAASGGWTPTSPRPHQPTTASTPPGTTNPPATHPAPQSETGRTRRFGLSPIPGRRRGGSIRWPAWLRWRCAV